jgi:PAS domain S-box-containing protein
VNKYKAESIYSPAPNQYATLLIDITEQKTSELHVQLQNSILQGINQITHESIGLKNEDQIKPLCLSVIENILQSKSSFIINSESKEVILSESGSLILKSSDNHKSNKTIIDFEKFCNKEYKNGFYSNDPAFISTIFKLPFNCPTLSSIICMPLIQDGEMCGIIGAANKIGGYSNDDLDLLEAVVLTINQTFVQIRTNNALFESEKKYRSLFEAMNEGAALLQIVINQSKKPVDFIFVDVNRAFTCSFNITLPEILGRKASELNQKVLYLNTFYEVAVSGKPTSFEAYFERTGKYFRISAYSVERLKIAVIFTDITARKRMEEALRESEEKYRLLFNKMIDGFTFNEIILDLEGKPVDYMFHSVNPAFEKQSGYKAIDLVGKKASQIMPILESYWSEVFGAVALTGENIEFEYYKKKSNRYYKVSAFSTRKGYFAVIYNDITNRKIAEIELQKTIEYDLQYIQNFSIWLDIKILFQTAFAVFKGEGAY